MITGQRNINDISILSYPEFLHGNYIANFVLSNELVCNRGCNYRRKAPPFLSVSPGQFSSSNSCRFRHCWWRSHAMLSCIEAQFEDVKMNKRLRPISTIFLLSFMFFGCYFLWVAFALCVGLLENCANKRWRSRSWSPCVYDYWRIASIDGKKCWCFYGRYLSPTATNIEKVGENGIQLRHCWSS